MQLEKKLHLPQKQKFRLPQKQISIFLRNKILFIVKRQISSLDLFSPFTNGWLSFFLKKRLISLQQKTFPK